MILLIDWDAVQAEEDRKSAQAKAQLRCACGRFAKPQYLTGDSRGNTWEMVLCAVHGLTPERGY